MEVKMKKGGKNFFNRTGILVLGLMLFVVAVAGCASEQGSEISVEKMESGKPSAVDTNIKVSGDKSKVYLNITLYSIKEIPNSTIRLNVAEYNRNKNGKILESTKWNKSLQKNQKIALNTTFVPPKNGIYSIKVLIKDTTMPPNWYGTAYYLTIGKNKKTGTGKQELQKRSETG